MNTLQELWAIFVALWNTGNRIARATILFIVLWPILVCVVALMGSSTATSIAALIPVAAIAFSIVAALDPIVIAVIAAFKKGRAVLTWIVTIIAAELVLGVYFSIVPVWNDRGLVPVVVLVAVAIFFLAVGTKGKIQKTAISAMTLIVIILTIIFFLGGRDKAAGKFESKPPKTADATMAATTKSLTIMWGEHQIIDVSANNWSTSYNIKGKEFVRVSLDKEGDAVEVLADGKYLGVLDAHKQVDFGIARELQFRSIGKDSKVQLRIGRTA